MSTKPDVKIEAVASLSRSLDEWLSMTDRRCMGEGCSEPIAGVFSMIVAGLDGQTTTATAQCCAAHLQELRHEMGERFRPIARR